MDKLSIRPNRADLALLVPGTGIVKINACRDSVRDMLDSLNDNASRLNSYTHTEISLCWCHELVHYIQSISTRFLYQYALNTINGSMYLLQHLTSFFDDPEKYSVLLETQNTLLKRQQELSAHDICEGMAVLESFRMVYPEGSLKEFLESRTHWYPGDHHSPYRRSFDYLAYMTDPHLAFQTLSALSYISLQTDNPGEAFNSFVGSIIQSNKKSFKSGELLKILGIDAQDTFPWTFEDLDSKYRHPVLFRCAKYFSDSLGKNNFFILGGAPSIIFSNKVATTERSSFFPPVVMYQYTHGEKVRGDLFNIGNLDDKFYWLMIDVAAYQGAAERISLYPQQANTYMACPYKECAHFSSALCHRKYPPPNVGSGWERCTFPRDFMQVTGMLPNEAWRKTQELISTRKSWVEKTNQLNMHGRDSSISSRFDHFCDQLNGQSLIIETTSTIKCNNCGQYQIINTYFIKGRTPQHITSQCEACRIAKRVDVDDMAKFSWFDVKNPSDLL